VDFKKFRFSPKYLAVFWIVEFVLIYFKMPNFDGYVFEYFSWLVITLTIFFFINYFCNIKYGKNFTEFMYSKKEK
jgi:hypothetical protein